MLGVETFSRINIFIFSFPVGSLVSVRGESEADVGEVELFSTGGEFSFGTEVDTVSDCETTGVITDSVIVGIGVMFSGGIEASGDCISVLGVSGGISVTCVLVLSGVVFSTTGVGSVLTASCALAIVVKLKIGEIVCSKRETTAK